MKKNISRKNLIKIVGLIIIIFIIFRQINIKEFYIIFSSINLWLLILSSLLIIPFLLIKMFRWHYILKKLGINYPIKKILRIYNLSLLFGIITPLNSGDPLSRITFLKKDGHQIKTSLVSIFIDRLADLIILLLITIIGLIFFLKFFGQKILILSIVFFIVLILGLFSLKINFLKKLGKKIFLLIIPKKIREKWQQYLKETLNNIECLGFKNLIIILFLTILAQLALLLYLYSLTKILNITQIPILYLLLANAVTSFVTLIPISIGGFGTREAALMAMFSILEVQNEKTIIFSLAKTLLPTMILILTGLYFWMKEYRE